MEQPVTEEQSTQAHLMVGLDRTVEFMETFDIVSTASFILRNNFERVALQFPDELLKHSVVVTSALKKEITKQRESTSPPQQSSPSLRLFVMADTTFGSCCADEVAAMHADAQCIVHYGHTCLSKTSRLPVWFVFGKATINAKKCGNQILRFSASSKQSVLVMSGLRYAHALPQIKQQVSLVQGKDSAVTFVSALSQLMEPSPSGKASEAEGSEFNVGGLNWVIPEGRGMEDYSILWIGDEDPGLTNMALTFNTSTFVRYDCGEDRIVTDVGKKSQLLQRRYYLVERAKDANIVGIVVGTLGVAGYGETIQRMRAIVEAAGKKSYVLVMGKPNPSKLANFPECEVFVLVACPQTALLDSREFLAPVITPFEAELAFVEGKQWTGAYRLDFGSGPASETETEAALETSEPEPRFSFFTGSYVGRDNSANEDSPDGDVSSRAVLARASQHALQLQSESGVSVVTTGRQVLDIKSGAEFLASRTYQGLENNREEGPRTPALAVVGRKGRAAGYTAENGTDH